MDSIKTKPTKEELEAIKKAKEKQVKEQQIIKK
jgi:hypothetical protein